MKKPNGRAFFLGALFMSALCLAGAVAAAETRKAGKAPTPASAEEVRQLRRRIDELEKEIQELKRLIREERKAAAQTGAKRTGERASSGKGKATASASATEKSAHEETIANKERLIKLVRDEIERIDQEKRKERPLDMRAYWKDGLSFATNDGQIKLKLFGRIESDWAWINDSKEIKRNIGEQADGVEVRRARLGMSGLFNDSLEFKMEYDFAGGDADFKDVCLGLRNVPLLGHVRAGHIKEPFSLEAQTSGKYVTFIERALPNAFSPERNVGLMTQNTLFDKRMTWAVGIFRDADNFGFGRGNGDISTTMRVTALPWCADKGAKLLHLGLSYSYRKPENDEIRYRSRPECHLADAFANTGWIPTDGVHMIGAESAIVLGPFSAAAEYVTPFVDAKSRLPGDDSLRFQGYYVQASYFLTGEHRPYSKSTGTFGRIRPKRNFLGKGGVKGPGAWEVAARLSGIDLDDSAVRGGDMTDFTIGVNWYWNPYMKIMFDYINSNLDRDFAAPDVDGHADIFMVRLHLDF